MFDLNLVVIKYLFCVFGFSHLFRIQVHVSWFIYVFGFYAITSFAARTLKIIHNTEL